MTCSRIACLLIKWRDVTALSLRSYCSSQEGFIYDVYQNKNAQNAAYGCEMTINF